MQTTPEFSLKSAIRNQRSAIFFIQHSTFYIHHSSA